MALSKITYDNKVSLNPQPSVANENKCTDSDLNEIKSVVNAGIDAINGNEIMGDIVVDGIRTKNMFDKNTIVAGDIIGNSPTIRLSSRQSIWLEAGTYTFSCNLTSPLRWSLNVQNVATPPLSTYTTYIYDSGWLAYSTTSHTFTINTAGWFCLMLSKENNATLTPEEVKGFNYQLEVGNTATTYKPYQNLTGINEVYSTSEIQIGYWLGKPLYRKSYNFGQVDGTSYTISNAFSNVAEIISISGSYKTGLYDRVPISVYYSDTYNCATTLNLNTNTIGIGWVGWPRLLGGNIIVEYTKTTD